MRHPSLSLIIFPLILTRRRLVLLVLLLAPVVSAASAHKDQVHAVLGRVHKCHSLVVTALALHVLAAGQSRVLNTFLVNLEEELGAAFARGGRCRLLWLTRAIHTVVCLVILLGLLEVPTDSAVINKTP